MEEIIKMQIHKLRMNGMGLRTIAKYTKQPFASVQYHQEPIRDLHEDMSILPEDIYGLRQQDAEVLLP